MCGIVGFIGEQPAAPILLEGLSKLEYRGYDSAGIAVRNEKTDKIAIVKAKGRLKILAEKTDNGKYEVTGEGYVITSKDSLYRHLKCLKKELQGKCIWYYHIDSAGCVLRKEKDHELYT